MARRYVSTLVVVLALALSACSASRTTDNTTTLSDGSEYKPLRVSVLKFTSGEAFLVLEYQTNLQIDDHAALNREADAIWSSSFKAQAEKAEMKKAAIRAHEPPNKFWAFFGINIGKIYGSVYDKSEDGTWSRNQEP